MTEGILFALLVVLSIVTMGLSLLTYRQAQMTHRLVLLVNQELAVATRNLARAEGYTEGESAERGRAPNGPFEVVGVSDPAAEPIRTLPAEKT